VHDHIELEQIDEGRTGVGRVEAFSDGVIAIIVTIMVLELKAPETGGVTELLKQWPIFTAYALSFTMVAIYWVNHHLLFSHATKVTSGLLWSNNLLLFTLSLVPFGTAYLGFHHFSMLSVQFYLFLLFLPTLPYSWLQSLIRKTGKSHDTALQYYRRYRRKGTVCSIIYLIGMALSWISPLLGLSSALIVAILWISPRSPLDALFDPKT
jgi:uncharacterized membrane protein